jgi:hypothetical protein
MEAVKERLRERTLDILDWVDYRPDPHWWQYVATAGVLSLAYFFTPMDLWPVLLLANVGVTLLGMALWFAGLFAVIAWRALRDVIEVMLRRRRVAGPMPRTLVGRLN